MLRTALASLYDLNTGGEFSYEILVVDNNSSDDTPAFIERCQSESRAPLRNVREPRPGVAAARNRGVREARGKWIAFFDDDQVADRDWLRQLRKGALELNSRFVGGAVHLLLPEGTHRDLDATCRMLLGESKWSTKPRRYDHRINPGCGNMMVARSVFEEVGLFDERIRRGEDTDLYRRATAAGIASWYLPDAIIHHITPEERLTDAYLLKLSYTMGDLLSVVDWEIRPPWWAAALWFAKGCRLVLLHWPWLQLEKLRGRKEQILGRRCQLSISTGHFTRGWEQFRRWLLPTICRTELRQSSA